jgi:hypothetical protein
LRSKQSVVDGLVGASDGARGSKRGGLEVLRPGGSPKRACAGEPVVARGEATGEGVVQRAEASVAGAQAEAGKETQEVDEAALLVPNPGE